MKKFLSVILAVSTVLCSCHKEPGVEEEKYVEFSLTVSLDTTVVTKTTMEDDGTVGKVKWSSTDYLVLYNDDSWYIRGISSQCATNISADGNSADFKFNIYKSDAEKLSSMNSYLFYGDTTKVTVNSSREKGFYFTLSIPAAQTHPGLVCFEEFENTAFGYCPSGTFQYQEISGNYVGKTNCIMRNAFGILKVPVSLTEGNMSTIRYVRLTDKTSGQYLAGTFDVSVSTSGATAGTPTLTHQPKTGGESLTIEKTIPKGSLTSANPYVYFLVPPGTLFGTNGLSLAVYTDDGYYGNKSVTPKAGSGMAIERSKITQLNISTFQKKKYPPVTTSLTANSYIFDATAGVASFPAKYMGNGCQGNGGDIQSALQKYAIAYSNAYYPEIIWQTKCNGDKILAAEVVDSPVYYNDETNGPCISFHKSGVPGNALIALKDGYGNILWSWHVWITSEKEATDAGILLTKQYSPYDSVIRIMDRNLGALYANPTTQGHETQTHGLGYQFGRKDPYMGSRYTHTDQNTSTEYQSYASIYPETAIFCIEGDEAQSFTVAKSVSFPYKRSLRTSKDWCSDLVSWGDKDSANIMKPANKCLYDPCPVGWRTFEERNIITALGRDSKENINRPDGYVVRSGPDGYAFVLNNNNNIIYFPSSGMAETTLAVTNVGNVVALWGSNYSTVISGQTTHTQAHLLQISLTSSLEYTSSVSVGYMENTMAVRCQRWNEPTVTKSQSAPARAAGCAEATEVEECEEAEAVILN